MNFRWMKDLSLKIQTMKVLAEFFCVILKEQHLAKFDMKPRICNPNYIS